MTTNYHQNFKNFQNCFKIPNDIPESSELLRKFGIFKNVQNSKECLENFQDFLKFLTKIRIFYFTRGFMKKEISKEIAMGKMIYRKFHRMFLIHERFHYWTFQEIFTPQEISQKVLKQTGNFRKNQESFAPNFIISFRKILIGSFI